MDDVGRKVRIFLNSMYDQVKFQHENEQLPAFQRRIDDREYIAQRLDNINPDYADLEFEYVRNKRIALGLDEAAN